MFWDTIKPFMTQKVRSVNENIRLKVGDSIINENSAVANAFNEYCGQVASTIGNDNPIDENECIEDIIESHNNHLIIQLIRENIETVGPDVHFREVNDCDVKKLIENLEKGPGYDTLPPKLIKAASAEFTKPLTSLINQSVKLCHFHDGLKMAELAPLCKSSDSLYTVNNRPVNVLTCFSTILKECTTISCILTRYCQACWQHLGNITTVSMSWSILLRNADKPWTHGNILVS